MKKNLIYSGILVSVLLVSLVSAGWFTGNVVGSKTCDSDAECFGGYCAKTLYIFGGTCKCPAGKIWEGNQCVDACEKAGGVCGIYLDNANNIGDGICADYGCWKCKEGFVYEGGNCIVNSCTDSDGGVNIYEKGEVKHEDTPGHTYIDDCMSSYLIEYFCNDEGFIEQSDRILCDYGCENGACLTEEEYYLECRDSDMTKEFPDGKNYYKKGKVTLGNTSKEDKCNSEEYLVEYYCDKNVIKQWGSWCSIRCENGACVREICGDGICSENEDYLTCPEDCLATHESVLKMLNNCEYIQKNNALDSSISCNQICQEKDKTCIIGGFVINYVYGEDYTWRIENLPFNCNEKISLDGKIICTCC